MGNAVCYEDDQSDHTEEPVPEELNIHDQTIQIETEQYSDDESVANTNFIIDTKAIANAAGKDVTISSYRSVPNPPNLSIHLTVAQNVNLNKLALEEAELSGPEQDRSDADESEDEYDAPLVRKESVSRTNYDLCSDRKVSNNLLMMIHDQHS